MHSDSDVDRAFADLTRNLDLDVWQPEVFDILSATDPQLRLTLRRLRSQLVRRGELHAQSTEEGRQLRGDFDLVSAVMLERGVV